MPNERKERVATLAQVLEHAKTPVGILVVALFILDGAIAAIAITANISPSSKGWLLFFALAIILIIAVCAAISLFRRPEPQSVEQPIKAQAKSDPRLIETVKSDGVKWTVSPDGRSEAYEKLRGKARHRISILGIAMTDLTNHVLRSLEDNGKRVNVDLAMIDPEYLKTNKDIAEELGTAFDIAFMADKAQQSFSRLKAFCEKWNENPNNVHKFQFKVYQHLPAFGVVMIDDDESDGEMISEIYLYKICIRPRFELVSHKNTNGLYDAFRLEYKEVWKHARCVVPSPK
jgi:hypothetical protein